MHLNKYEKKTAVIKKGKNNFVKIGIVEGGWLMYSFQKSDCFYYVLRGVLRSL